MDPDELRSALPHIDPLVLAAITQAVGDALWHVQELETTVATYLVLVHGFQSQVAQEEAETLLEKSKKKTLGQLVHGLKGTDDVPTELTARLSTFVERRNWLAHRSKADSRP